MTNGFIAGCFDIIHPGYINMFIDSKSICDYLIVGLQSDPSIDRPTKNKPIHTIKERRLILSSIKYVDEIIEYSTEKDLYRLLKKLIDKNRINVRILGSDYVDKQFTGDDLVVPIKFKNRDHD